MKFSTAIFSAFLLTNLVDGTTFKGTITITSLAPTNGNCITPVWIGVHDGNFDLYDRNVAAPDFLESLAEDGSNDATAAAFAGTTGALFDDTLASAAGPICPGETATATFTVDEEQSGPLYFSYASMILPSNDAFVANGDPLAHTVLNAAGHVQQVDFVVAGSEVLDAGTEINNEDVGVAFLNQNMPNEGDTENGVVRTHPGFDVGGTILSATNAGPRSLDFTGADFSRTSNYNIMRVQVQVYKTDDDDDADNQDGGGLSCFSSNAMVDVWNADGGVPMKDIKVGDMVRTAKNHYQPIYAFGHYNEDKSTEFVKLSYQAGSKTKSIELSGEHLLYIQGKTRPVRADSISKGDVLLHSDATMEAKVTKVTKVTSNGFYAPLTEDGTIVVDGVVASVYATLLKNSHSEQIELNGWTFPFADQETFLHMAAAPLRMLCKTNADFCQIDGNKANAEGFHPYVSWGISMISWGEIQHASVQVVVFIPVFALFGALNVLEVLLYGGAGPLWKAVMSLVAVAIVMGVSGSNKKGGIALKTAA